MTITQTRTWQQDPAHPDPHGGVPFHRLLRVELRKLVDTRSGRWLITAILALTPLIVAGALVAARPADLTFDKLVDYVQTPQKILLPALGILAITSEWSARTGLVTFTLTPHRRRVLVAKVAALLLAGLISITCAMATAAVGNLLGHGLRGGNGSWRFGLGGLRDLLLVQLTGLLQGAAFGMLLLISSAAIILYYVLPNLWQLLFSAIPQLTPAAAWVDLNTAQKALYLHQMTNQAWAHFTVAATLWVLLPLLLGAARVSRSEITSG